jgi:DNA-directed RNA polymerase alpha subunit
MTVVSYRIYCDECTNQKVIKERHMADDPWKINSEVNHSGLCPACNPAVDVDADSQYARQNEEVQFEELDAIGQSGAQNLREKGIETRLDVSNASDEEILDTAWIGEKGLKSIRQEVSLD